MSKDDNFFIKPTSDIFVVTFLSDPKNEPCLRSIINAVLKDKGEQKPIEQAIVLNPYSIRNYAVDKQIVVDVRVEAIGCAFNVEIQTCPHPAFRERALFGWSNSYSSQLPPGSDYKTLKPVVYIVITEFAVISGVSRVHLLFELREREHRNCLLSDHIQIHFWQLQELKKGNMEVLKEVSPDMSHWSQFFAFGDKKSEVEMAALTENDPRIIEAYQEFQRFNSDPATRELARQRQMFLLDYNWGMSASKEEGIAETEAKWQAKEAKWQADRIAKARELKRRGVDYETIMIATELSVDEIKHLE